MEEKIVLDEKSFKALSADSRINILKNLADRRRTLSELSQKLNLGSSTIKEHCDILVNAELIKQMDEGRKWKYYELTSKGKQIIRPSIMEEVKVLIVLSIATVVVGGFVFMVMASMNSFAQGASVAGVLQDQIMEKTTSTTLNATSPGLASASTAQTIEGISTEFFVISTMLSLIVGMMLGWIVTRKR